jgi:hypothetical protein
LRFSRSGTALSCCLNWRKRAPHSRPDDWVFRSTEMHGTQPYWPDSLMRRSFVLRSCVLESAGTWLAYVSGTATPPLLKANWRRREGRGAELAARDQQNNAGHVYAGANARQEAGARQRCWDDSGRSSCGRFCLMAPSGPTNTQAQLVMLKRYGRHDWTRTSDLYRVKVAL